MKKNATKHISSIVFFILVCLSPLDGFADVDPKSKNFTLSMENDFFNRTDFYYTSGLKLTWTTQDLKEYCSDPRLPQCTHSLINRIPFINRSDCRRALSLSIGQNIYTPQNIEKTELIENDRPYAGVSYAGIGFHNRTPVSAHSMEFNLGIVGPHSYAEEAQKAMHLWIDSAIPQGWRNQLNDEVFLVASYEYKRKLLLHNPGEGFGHDLIALLGGGLGNAYTYAQTGLYFRIGWNIPADFGATGIRPIASVGSAGNGRDPRCAPNRRFGIHIFGGLGGQAVARDIFLEGNTFENSHHVEKEPLVGAMMAGLGVVTGRFKFTIAQVNNSRAFKEQKYSDHSFGSMTVSYSY